MESGIRNRVPQTQGFRFGGFNKLDLDAPPNGAAESPLRLLLNPFKRTEGRNGGLRCSNTHHALTIVHRLLAGVLERSIGPQLVASTLPPCDSAENGRLTCLLLVLESVSLLFRFRQVVSSVSSALVIEGDAVSIRSTVKLEEKVFTLLSVSWSVNTEVVLFRWMSLS